jgi:hypothetical protein
MATRLGRARSVLAFLLKIFLFAACFILLVKAVFFVGSAQFLLASVLF